MIVDYFYLALYKFFSFLVKLLPTQLLNLLLKSLARFAFFIDKKHTKIIFANLDLAYNSTLTKEEKESIAKRVYYNLVQTIIGFMRREKLPKEKLLQNITFKNTHILENALKAQKKIVFVTGHYSNWELLPPAITAKFGITLIGVGRKLDSEMMDRVLLKNREQFGVEMLYRKGAMKGLIKSLREGKAVGLLVDQSLGEKQGGIKVDFFGKSVGHSPAASVLARTFETEIIPSFISTDDYEHYTVTFYEPLPLIKTENKEEDIHLMTQAQADITQQVIESKPEEWFWVHKRWKSYHPETYSEYTL